MTTHDHRADPPTGHEDPKDQAQRAAALAKDQGKQVGETAKSEARHVAADAQEQARHVLDDARTQVEEQSRTQLDNLVTTLKGFADDLERMARGEGAGGGIARDVVTQVSQRAQSLSSQIQGREPGELLDQVRSFARQRPGTFLLGALAAGVAAGRLTRGAKDAHSSTSSDASTATAQPATTPTASTDATTPSNPATPSSDIPPGTVGTATGDPLAGVSTPAPTQPPAYPEGTPSSASEGGTTP